MRLQSQPLYQKTLWEWLVFHAPVRCIPIKNLNQQHAVLANRVDVLEAMIVRDYRVDPKAVQCAKDWNRDDCLKIFRQAGWTEPVLSFHKIFS